jgi:hypothetical protein
VVAAVALLMLAFRGLLTLVVVAVQGGTAQVALAERVLLFFVTGWSLHDYCKF